ncbi:MAG TPA: hypothetical protein VEP89_16610, partial [Draconibacterium sp.]|nr:hypothetical protein [Draconibacterium sp.]
MEKIEEIISLIDSQEKKETKNIFLKYLKKWPWFVLLSVIGTGAGYYIYKNSPNTYKVQSKILIKKEDNSLSSVFSANNPIMALGKQANIENQVGILRSYTLYRKALKNLNWETSWYRKELLYDAELYKQPPFELKIPPNAINAKNTSIEIVALNDGEYSLKAEGSTHQNGSLQTIDLETTQKFGEPYVNEFFNFTLERGNGEAGKKYMLHFNDINTLTTQYLAKTNIEMVDLNSDLISISIEGEMLYKEADFINELNEVFIEFGMQNKNKNSENSVQFIDSQLSRIKSSLGTAEERFSNYRKNNQVMNLGQEAQFVYEKLEEIEQEQYLTQLQIDYYTDLQQYLDNSKKIEEMVNPSVIGITDQNLNGMLDKLMDLYSRREVLSY